MSDKPNAMPEQENILFHTALFEQVTPEQAEGLIEHLNRGTYDKGDVIFQQGATDHRMYFLESGRVKLIRESADHRVQLLSIHAPGEMLGEILAANRFLSEKGEEERVSHVVLMGSGEPLDNYDEVIRFLRLLREEEGVRISQGWVSLSLPVFSSF